MKIAIINTVLPNSGDAAILEEAAQLLKQNLGEYNLDVYDDYPTWSTLAYPDLSIFDHTYLTAVKIATYDLILLTGGTYLVPPYNLDRRFDILKLVTEKSHCPIIALPMTCGPFSKSVAWSEVLNKLSVIMLRDRASYYYLIKIGVRPQKLKIVPDTVWSMDEGEVVSHPKSHRYLISVRDWGDNPERFINEMGVFCQRILRDKNNSIVFASTCQGVKEYIKDDSEVAMAIWQQLPPSMQSRVIVDRRHYSATEYRTLAAQFGLVVATRMHAAILAIQAGVPVVPISYQPKFMDNLRYLGLQIFTNYYDELDGRLLYERVIAMQRDWVQLAPTIKERRLELSQQVKQSFRTVFSRILIVLHDLPKRSETFVMHELKALLKQGWWVEVVAAKAEENIKLPDWFVNHPKFKVRYLDNDRTGTEVDELVAKLSAFTAYAAIKPFWSPAQLFHLNQILNTERYSNVYCHFGYTGVAVGLLRSIGELGFSLITKVHGYDMSALIKTEPLVYQNLIEQSTDILATTKRWQRLLISMGAAPAQVHYHTLSIPTIDFCWSNKRAWRRYDKNSQVSALVVGRLVDKKGFDDAISALNYLVAEWPNIQLVIVGQGERLADWQKLAASKKVDHSISWVGQQSHEDVIKLMQRADIFIAPSKDSKAGDMEGLPTVIMEAMSLGLPVVTTNHSGIPELIHNKITGMLVEQSDPRALAGAFNYWLKLDGKERSKLLKNARLAVDEQHNITVNGQTLTRLLQQFTRPAGSREKTFSTIKK